MADKVKPIPDGYNSVTAYLIVDGAERAIEFYKTAFGAVEELRMPLGGKIGHAEIRIGDSKVMLADEFPEMGFRGPGSDGAPVSIHLFVEDVDGVVAKAVAAGATVQRPVENQFYGDRIGTIRDPFGHTWSVATHIEDVSLEEAQKRAAAAGNG